jgi:uncharacterized membrane protein SpoIIM required for sporulation
VRVGLAHFQREELLGREIDVLNLRWGWRLFLKEFINNAKNISAWYKVSVFPSVKHLWKPVLIMLLVCFAGVLVGKHLVRTFPLPLDGIDSRDWKSSIQSSLDMWPLFSRQNFLAFLGNNLRFMILSLILGLLSLGILGVIPTLATVAVTSYLVVTLAQAGLPGGQVLFGFILPHGWLEIGAGILSSAAILQGGARLASANSLKTIGEVFITSIAEWFKIFLGIVLPALIVAAAIEVWLTPRIASWVLGG